MGYFKPGQKVRYSGNNNAIKDFIGNIEFIVEEIHIPGSPTNFGERNCSGKNIYRVYNQKARQHFIFTEDELTAVNDDDETLEEYNKKEKAYNRAHQAMIQFRDPKKELPEPNRQLLLKIESPYTYEQGYIYDGKNFRRYVFEVGEIITKPVLGWAYQEEFHHQNKD